MYRHLVSAAALLLCAAPAARAEGLSSAPPAPAAASPAPAWKQVYEDSQAIIYVDASGVQRTGQSSVASLLEYKIPQVIEGAQVWSIVSHIKLSCDENRMVTSDNTLYAAKMGAGPVVEAQPANDDWHQPQPGTLGALIWTTACGKS